MKFIRRKRKTVWFSIVLCVFLIGLTYFIDLSVINDSLSFFVLPVQKIMTATSNAIGNKFRLVTDLVAIEDENIKLKVELEKSNLQLEELRYLREENMRLTNLLKLEQNFNFPLLGAHVIAKDYSNWYDAFVIDKGSADGLKVDMPVLLNGYLIGRIVACHKNYAKVATIIDDGSSVSVKNTRTSDLGFIKGDLKLKADGLCSLELIDNKAQVIDGDEFVTSQLSEVYPPGLLVGHAMHSQIEPAADLKHIDTVVIIQKVFTGDESLANFD